MERDHIESLDKLQRQDHDTLIEVKAMLGGLITDVKEMKDGIHVSIADHETRLRIIEKVHEAVQPEESNKQLHDVIQWQRDLQRDLQRSRRLIAAVAAGIGSFVGVAFQYLANRFNWF